MSIFNYGVSGDVRGDLNAFLPSTHPNYQGEEQIPGALITEGLDWATCLINAKLRPLYPDLVPWASGDVPRFVDKLCNCLAKGFIIDSLNPGPAPESQNKHVTRAEKCEEYLNQLASGEVEMPEVDQDAAGEEIGHTHEGISPTMEVDDTLNQRQSQTNLDDIETRRERND